MATIKNPANVGTSVRSGADMARIEAAAFERVSIKARKMSMARILELLPLAGIESTDTKAMVANRRGIRRALCAELRRRGVEFQEWMSGPTYDNGQSKPGVKRMPNV